MTDRRPIDSISTDELEQGVRIRRTEERAARLRKMAHRGRLAGPMISPLEPLPQSTAPAPVRRRRTLWDNLLLVIELGAVAGLAFVLVSQFSAMQSIRDINTEFAEALALLALAPTALITAYPYLVDTQRIVVFANLATDNTSR